MDSASRGPRGDTTADGAFPRGVVTFLFTDIEGSTRLLQEAGASYVALLEDHRRLLANALAAHGGSEINRQGDSLVAAFAGPVSALTAAADAQRALAGHRWPPGRTVRVRMGIHTGEVIEVGGDYVSLAAHKAARIAATAHGGQVVVSDATAALSRDALPAGVSLRELGAHALKDFPEPTKLFQLEAPGLGVTFPPLKARVSPTRVPAPPTSVVGRDRDVAAVADLLRDEDVRLVTLTGPGGVGKTRLALETARVVSATFPGGAVFVPLGAVADPDLVLHVVADALGARAEAGGTILRTLTVALEGHRTLLLLDNFEQVVAAAPAVAALLESAPTVVALVTSRKLLRLRAERPYHVAPLAPADAVGLFVERAAAARPGFALSDADTEAVTEICRRLDGLPLAIELAAARVRLLPPAALLTRMSEQLDVLGSGPVDLPERQRTLRATLDWSYNLLAPYEQTVFARLGVFAGGCTITAAETVCGRDNEPATLDAVSELLANSLLVSVDDGPQPRLDMLETVHGYARAKLAELPDRAQTERRHTEWVLTMLAARLAARGREHRRWLEQADRERANLRAAVERALGDDVVVAARLIRDAFVYLAHRDAEAELLAWLERALRISAPAPAVRGRLLVLRSLIATVSGDCAPRPPSPRRCRRSQRWGRSWGARTCR